MKNSEIKEMVNGIIGEQSNAYYTDDGSGCGGPGCADAETLQYMLDHGEFDDAVVVDYDPELFGEVAPLFGHDLNGDETEWVQVECNFENDPYYCQIFWLWHV